MGFSDWTGWPGSCTLWVSKIWSAASVSVRRCQQLPRSSVPEVHFDLQLLQLRYTSISLWHSYNCQGTSVPQIHFTCCRDVKHRSKQNKQKQSNNNNNISPPQCFCWPPFLLLCHARLLYPTGSPKATLCPPPPHPTPLPPHLPLPFLLAVLNHPFGQISLIACSHWAALNCPWWVGLCVYTDRSQNNKKTSISVCLSACLSAFLSACLPLSVCLSVCLSVSLPPSLPPSLSLSLSLTHSRSLWWVWCGVKTERWKNTTDFCVCLSVCLPARVCLSVSVCPPAFLPVSQSVCLSVCLPAPPPLPPSSLSLSHVCDIDSYRWTVAYVSRLKKKCRLAP